MKTNGVVYPGSPGGPAFGPARDGGVWVMAERCATCIFRPGNLMGLRDGTVALMKRNADELGTCIVCHEVMDGENSAVCRGYYDSHKSDMLKIAEDMGLILEIKA